MAICSVCGARFNLREAKGDFRVFLADSNYSDYFSSPTCIDCAKGKILDKIQQDEFELYEDLYEENEEEEGELYTDEFSVLGGLGAWLRGEYD